MTPYVIENNIISENQSGFKQLLMKLEITHEIFSSFDDNCEVRVGFLDISKVFDKEWQERIIHKIKCTDISGNWLNLLTDFFRNREQRVIPNGQSSSWDNITFIHC